MKTILTSAMAAAMLLGASSVPSLAAPTGDTVFDLCDRWSLYSDETCGCVAEAADALPEGQQALLLAFLDDDFNVGRTYRDEDLDGRDWIAVRGFMWTQGTSCVLDRIAD